MTKASQTKKGFTIIEVLIVLAIAGLILLIVFLAVPALQRNSRNTQRKSDVSALLGSVSEFTSNNNGRLPTASANFETAFAGAAPALGFYTTPANVTYNYSAAARTGTPPVPAAGNDAVVVYNNAKCAGTALTFTGASARSVAALYNIEGSANNLPQCTDS